MHIVMTAALVKTLGCVYGRAASQSKIHAAGAIWRSVHPQSVATIAINMAPAVALI
jgi:hypothetical protein